MVIPTSSNYPGVFDTDENLHVVHDALRVKLVEDYSPGDISITIEGDSNVIARFPDSGIITLTEQVSDIDDRAISLFYSSRTATSFDELELFPEFTDVAKPKNLTNVTMNVTAPHHNNLKDSLIAIEEFIGIQGATDRTTLSGRINFLKALILSPRAWFSVDRRVGLVPLEVTFTDESFRLARGAEACGGTDGVMFIWNFGDQTTSVISGASAISGLSATIPSFCDVSNVPSNFPTICVTSVVPIEETQVIVKDIDGGTVQKTYSCPGVFDVSLTIMNDFGEDTVVFYNLITALTEAPDEATIDFIPTSFQLTTSGTPSGGPFEIPPTIRSAANSLIEIEVRPGNNPSNLGRTFAGELLNTNTFLPIDPIQTYTWSLGDDLDHINAPQTKASYSIGGLFDLVLRVDTEFGAYRITTYEDAIDIVEQENLWLWTFQSTSVKASEFGLISETFKLASTGLTVTRDNSFLDGTNNEEQAKAEFARNTGFASRGLSSSNFSGTTLLFWASGGPLAGSLLDHEVNIQEYNGFQDTYTTQTSISSRPWNWAFLNSGAGAFFLFGQNPTAPPDSNPSFQVKTTYNLTSLTSSDVAIGASFYKNGANELEEHVSQFTAGLPDNGFFAVYRTTWKDSTGYVIRNSGVGSFFRLSSFYQTEGTMGDPLQLIRKMPDMPGTPKLEGQLVPLSTGVFFFNNSGNISAFNDVSGVWETGGPSAGSLSFRSVQDTSVNGFDDPSNTLLAASNGDRTVYLSYDYSTNAFIKFNGVDLTFVTAGARPSGEQWIMGIY